MGLPLETNKRQTADSRVQKVKTYIYGLDNPSLISDHTKDTAPVSHQLTEVKLLQALAVLWWGTTWEGRVSDKITFYSF